MWREDAEDLQANTVISLWKGLDIVFTKNLGTDTTTKYFMANGLRVAEMVNSTVYYYHEDILGSTRLLSTGSATTRFGSNYEPYGVNYGSSGTEVFQYTGKPQDSVTGYYNFGARYYDPSTGRFITQDSSSGIREDPQSLNRYTYARNNPEGITDPNGHGWNPFAGVVNALSNAANQVTSTATAMNSAISNAWNSMPPNEQQAVEVTAAIAIVAAVSVATLGAGTVPAAAAVGAALSSGIYTATAGHRASPEDALIMGAVGAIGGASTAGIAEAVIPNAVARLTLTGAAAATTGFLHDTTQAAVSHTPVYTSPGDVVTRVGLSLVPRPVGRALSQGEGFLMDVIGRSMSMAAQAAASEQQTPAGISPPDGGSTPVYLAYPTDDLPMASGGSSGRYIL